MSHSPGDSLAHIRAKTLVTGGEVDAFTPLTSARALHAAIPGARLEIFAGAGHAHHWEYVNDYNQLVEGFLHEGR
jgi:pimeloyl-ACP methyl ester carboxylesterase